MGKYPVGPVAAYAMGFERIAGVPMRAAGNILVEFLVFGAALVITGGAEVSMNFAAGLLG